METTVTVERLIGDESEDFLPSHEILRENLNAVHKRRPAKKRIKKFICKICKEVFQDQSTLEIHKNTHDPTNPYACNKCMYKTHNKKYLSRHVRKVHNKSEYKQECEYCGKKFMYKCLLDKHVRVHTGEKPNVCDVCGKAFNSLYSLNTHKLIHTNEKPFKCAFCDHACRDSSSLRKHQNIHLGISKKYPCEECNTKYDRKGLLEDHIKRVHRRKDEDQSPKMKCDTCGKNFNHRRTLVIHIRSVHDKSTSCICGICGKYLTYNANLKSHMRTHLDIKPFKCYFPGCTNRYKDKGSLKKHTIIHYPDKQMYCNECGKGFTRKIRLISHFAIHEPKVKNTKCSLCGVCFYNKNYLLTHMRIVHGERTKFTCDACGFESLNKPGLVMHIKSAHSDKKCRICQRSFKRKCDLVKHYRYTHDVAVKSKIKQKPMVVIKQEPLDFLPDLEIDLLDIDKEEPFAGFDIEPRDQCNTSLSSQQKNNERTSVRELDDKLKRAEDTECHTRSATTQVIQDIAAKTNENKNLPTEETQKSKKLSKLSENTTQANPANSMQVDEFIQRIISNNDTEVITQTEETTVSINSEATLQAESGRKAMPVDEFLQHVMSDTELPNEDIDEESEDYVKMRINELIEESNKKNGIVKKNAALGRRLEKVHVDEITKFLFTNVNIEVDGKIITPLQDKRRMEKKIKKKRKKSKRMKEDREKRKRILEENIGNNQVQYHNENNLSNNAEDSEEKKVTEDTNIENSVDIERDKNTTKRSTGIKMKFDLHQCYVCFKLFPTKPQLIQHCKEHFDVCNEITLKKCPMCNFVTHHNIKRHMKLKHKTDINFSFMRIKDKKVNENGSRYYFDTNDDTFRELEIIPSIKILNKKASMDLDKKNRELKDKSLLKRKLVRKGKEWVVETEKIDVSNHVVPKFKNKDDYLAKMKRLSVEAKKNKMKMLYPCNTCDKICQNLSALTLHMRRHDPNAKPFKPKKWQHKQKPGDKAGLPEQKNTSPQLDISNRDANPKPILTKHRCDPKLKAFYENNIKGGDIEFWQFLKIYNKMDRENVNDFEDLEARSDFGLHFASAKTSNDKNVNNNQQGTTNSNNSSSNTKAANIGSVASKKIRNKNGKSKYIRRIQLSREEHRRRCELKNKLREKIANTPC